MALPARWQRRDATVLAALAVALGLLSTLALDWTRLAPFGIHWSYALLGGLTVVQLIRSALTDDWVRRGAALATVFGVFVMVLGYQPAVFCATPSAPGCGPGVHLQPSLLVAGAIATGAMVVLDVYRGRRPGYESAESVR